MSSRISSGLCSQADRSAQFAFGICTRLKRLSRRGGIVVTCLVMVPVLSIGLGWSLALGQEPTQVEPTESEEQSQSPAQGEDGASDVEQNGQGQTDELGETGEEGPPGLDGMDETNGPPSVQPGVDTVVPSAGLPAPVGWSAQATTPSLPSAFPWLEHNGYFRFRPYYYHNLDLGTYRSDVVGTWTSGQAPPLSDNPVNADQIPDEDRQEGVYGADIRFRYQPSLHLTESIKVVGLLDVFDNYTLGSNPDAQFFRLDTPVQALAGGAAPLDYGSTANWSALRVKAAYVDWSTPVGLFQVGRVPDGWGLGVVHNGGDCLDCDFGDFKDRVSLTVPLLGFYAGVAVDLVSSGLTNNVFSQPYGRPRDLSGLDNVLEYNLMVMKAPLSTADQEQRRIRLEVDRRKVWEGGVRLSYRQQDYTSQYPLGDDTSLADAQAQVPWQGPQMWDNFQLLPIDFWMLTPDVWGRVEWQPKPGRHFKIELEAAARFGSIGAYQSEPNLDSVEVDIMGFGGVARGTFRNNKLKGGIEFGAASGGDPHDFGVYDTPALPATSGGGTDVNTFFFDRDYRVDLLLFNQVIGTVTNAIYAKPGIGYDFIQNSRDVVGVRGDVIMSMAWEPEQTPGDARLLGLEADVGLHWVRDNSITTMIKYGILVPFDGLDLPAGASGYPDGIDASLAHTVQGWMVLGF